MENIEQLKQDNAKLTERLNNAAKFFREQKAQIESLTKEKEELEKRFKEQESFETNTINKVVPELEEKIKTLEKENKQLQDQINSLEFNEESDANVINNYAEENKAFKEEISKYKNIIDSKDKAYKVLQDTYNELFGENTKLKEDLENRIKQIRATEKTYDEEQKKIIAARDEFITKYNTLKEEYDDVFKASQDLGKELAEAQANYINTLAERDKDLQEAIKSLKQANETIEQLQNQVVKLESDNDTLRKSDQEYRKAFEESKKDNEKLNQLYNDLENQKLGLECDFANLEDKYNNLKLQSESNSENEKYLIDKISDIREICNNVINPKPAKESTIEINSDNTENIEKPANKKEQPKHQFMTDALISM